VRLVNELSAYRQAFDGVTDLALENPFTNH